MTSERYTSPHRKPSPHERELLTILIEEAAEVQKCATKLLRFGALDIDPRAGDGITNDTRLGLELGDLRCMQQMLVEAGVISEASIAIGHRQKADKVQRFLQTEVSND